MVLNLRAACLLASVAAANAYVMAGQTLPSPAVGLQRAPSVVAVEKFRVSSKAARRELKLRTGTNWPPRTDPTPGKGYFFFRGPSPKTAVQEDLPSFFSAENFADLTITPAQVGVTVSGLASAAVLASVLLGGAPKISAPSISAPTISAPKAKEAPAPKA